MNARRRIPFTVIGGFLGAGKTTLVNHLLRESATEGQRQRVAVLVNDFGAINIDASLIEAQSSDTIALSNGCMCCSIGDDLTLALVRVLEAAPPFDAIVGEASGVSDPWRIAQIARADPTLTLEGIVVVVDASAVSAQGADPLLADTIERQLRAADLVLLNKTDLVDATSLAAAHVWVERTAGRVGIVETTEARVPLVLVTSERPEPTALVHAARSLRAAGAAHGVEFESATMRAVGSLSAARLRTWLKAMPDGVLRLKGIVATDEWTWAEIQFSGRHGSLREAPAPPADGVAAVVAIGLRGRLPRQRLGAGLASCAVIDDAN